MEVSRTHSVVSGNDDGRGGSFDVLDFKLVWYSFLGVVVVDGESIVGKESAVYLFGLEGERGVSLESTSISLSIGQKDDHTIFLTDASNGSLVIFSIANRHLWAYRNRSMNGSQSGRYRAVDN